MIIGIKIISLFSLLSGVVIVFWQIIVLLNGNESKNLFSSDHCCKISKDECKSVLKFYGRDYNYNITKAEFVEMFGPKKGIAEMKLYDILFLKYKEIDKSDAELEEHLSNVASVLKLRDSYEDNIEVYLKILPEESILHEIQIFHGIISYNVIKNLCKEIDQAKNDLSSLKKQGPVSYEQLTSLSSKYKSIFSLSFAFINALAILDEIEESATKLEGEYCFYIPRQYSLIHAFMMSKEKDLNDLLSSFAFKDDELKPINCIERLKKRFSIDICDSELKYKLYLAILSKHFARIENNLERAYSNFIESVQDLQSSRIRLSKELLNAEKLIPGSSIAYKDTIESGREYLKIHTKKVEFLIKEEKRLRDLYSL